MKGYKERLSMWRKALPALDKEASIAISCRNLNEYFKLGIVMCERPSGVLIYEKNVSKIAPNLYTRRCRLIVVKISRLGRSKGKLEQA